MNCEALILSCAELIEMLHSDLPDDLPVVFISSVSGLGIMELKDVIWNELNSKSNKLDSDFQEKSLVHRDLEREEIQVVFAESDDDMNSAGSDEEDGEILYI